MTDPWNLLRLAREHVQAQFEVLQICDGTENCNCSTARETYCLLEDIDKALAEYDKENGWVRNGRSGKWANYHGEHGEGFVVPNQVLFSENPPFFWRVFRKDHTTDEGWEDSFEEARKQANLALRRSENG